MIWTPPWFLDRKLESSRPHFSQFLITLVCLWENMALHIRDQARDILSQSACPVEFVILQRIFIDADDVISEIGKVNAGHAADIACPDYREFQVARAFHKRFPAQDITAMRDGAWAGRTKFWRLRMTLRSMNGGA